MNSELQAIARWGISYLYYQLDSVDFELVTPCYLRQLNEVKKIIQKNNPHPPKKELERIKAQLTDAHPHHLTNINILQIIIDKYSDILRGNISIFELLFTDGGVESLLSLYESTPETEFYNNLMGNIINEHINDNDVILELGAGIGATSSMVLSKLDNTLKQYSYTDVSKIFLYYGKKRFFQQYRFMDFKIVDINKLENNTNKYNLIFATDVLHNAREITNSIKHIASMLLLGGKLVVNETTVKNDYSTLIYGLFPGWWSFSDKEKRTPGSPLLDCATWLQVLQAAGFSQIKVTSEALPDKKSTQTIFVAVKTK